MIAEERETIIRISDADDVWTIYTARQKDINKLTKLGAKIINTYICDGEVYAYEFEVPKKYVTIRKPRQMSEEQKKASGDRLRKYAQNKKLSENDNVDSKDLK